MAKTLKKCKTCREYFVPAIIENDKVVYQRWKTFCYSCNPIDGAKMAEEKDLMSFLKNEKRRDISDNISKNKFKDRKVDKPRPQSFTIVESEAIKEVAVEEVITKKRYIKPSIRIRELESKTRFCNGCLREFPLVEEFFNAIFVSQTQFKFATKCRDCSSIRENDCKKLAVEYKGGKCERCGYSKCNYALEFHHTNPKNKEKIISRISKFDDNTKRELDKCIMLCANCHREEHYKTNTDKVKARREKFNKEQIIRKEVKWWV